MEDDFRNTSGEWLPWFKLENRERLLDMFAGWGDLTEEVRLYDLTADNRMDRSPIRSNSRALRYSNR